MPESDPLRQIIREELRPLRDEQALLRQLLTGNSHPETGIVVRLDRIEQAEARRVWIIRATVAAVIGAVVTSVKSMMSG